MTANHNVFGGMTLKALLENPDLQHAPAVLSGAQTSKTKKLGDGSAETDFTSAFLGPQLWDKTYNASDFNLEYMDLDEFLGENLNDIPIVENPGLDKLMPSPSSSPRQLPLQQQSTSPHVSPPHSPCSSSLRLPPTSTHSMIVPPVNMMSPSHFSVRPKVENLEEAAQKPADTRSTSPGAASSSSTPPVSPLPVHVDFSLTEQDIALSSIPGHSMFDPTSHTFTEDELKPQPMIKKSRKVFVPDDMKDEKYWARRKKNNYAAKRSRDARRVKENQIAMRAAYLEKENNSLRDEMEKIRRENARLKHRLSKYEPAQ